MDLSSLVWFLMCSVLAWIVVTALQMILILLPAILTSVAIYFVTRNMAWAAITFVVILNLTLLAKHT